MNLIIYGLNFDHIDLRVGIDKKYKELLKLFVKLDVYVKCKVMLIH